MKVVLAGTGSAVGKTTISTGLALILLTLLIIQLLQAMCQGTWIHFSWMSFK